MVNNKNIIDKIHTTVCSLSKVLYVCISPINYNTQFMKYITYYRVSTKDQSLGLDAQKRMVNSFLKEGDELIATFKEKETGTKKKVRIELSKAIGMALKEEATLLIAKLDRLSRNVYFVSKLLESGVKFKALDIPEADNFTIHIFAALAEKEARDISARTKAALNELKEQGVKLGGTYKISGEDRSKAREALKVKRTTNPNTVKATWAIRKMMTDNKRYTLNEMAKELNDNGFRTPRGKEFSPKQVSRLIERIKK